MRTLGALISSLIGVVSGLAGSEPKAPVNRRTAVHPRNRAEVDSAYFGRRGGASRLARAQRLCGETLHEPSGISVASAKQYHDALEKTIRDVAYDKRRAHRLPPTRTSTGLLAR